MHDRLNFLFQHAIAVEQSRYSCIYSSSILESIISAGGLLMCTNNR